MSATLFSLSTILLGMNSVEASPESCPQSLVLYYSHWCPHSRKVLDYLANNHLEVPMKDVTEDAEANKELQAKGGMLIVPCLMIDDKPLYDDDTIIHWIDDHRVCLKKTT